ncbi:hypothetical protein IQ217_12945 [Synechocystis salina LEGE 00031]|uniref:Uncharacterized protein n=1 Tax=Synechocystis salina LEGE 00031 TaxID=1828736 RepID=A0ABR9VUK7_9SYNC|nr:hypothetical protein [Synechocystis salina LEGE 00041]MBE9254726.1 hypothetical protein [Synechocystis salina LEGE 00031]
MLSMLHRLIKSFLITIFVLIYLVGFSAQAIAGEANLLWQGDGGYQVRAHVIYPDEFTDKSTKIVQVTGLQTLQNLTELTVQIVDDKGQILANYNNVNNGQVKGNDFLQFRFDPINKAIKGWLDIGGAGANDYFLKGQPDASLDLFHLNEYGNEFKIDHNNGAMDIRAGFYSKGRDS